MTLGGFLTQRQLFNYSVTVRMIAVIIFVTDRLRRPEYYDNDINDGSLLMCVRKNSVGNVAPLTVTLSPMPSVLPANTHTHARTQAHTLVSERLVIPALPRMLGMLRFSQRETCVVSAYCSDVCVNRLSEFYPPVTG